MDEARRIRAARRQRNQFFTARDALRRFRGIGGRAEDAKALLFNAARVAKLFSREQQRNIDIETDRRSVAALAQKLLSKRLRRREPRDRWLEQVAEPPPLAGWTFRSWAALMFLGLEKPSDADRIIGTALQNLAQRSLEKGLPKPEIVLAAITTLATVTVGIASPTTTELSYLSVVFNFEKPPTNEAEWAQRRNTWEARRQHELVEWLLWPEVLVEVGIFGDGKIVPVDPTPYQWGQDLNPRRTLKRPRARKAGRKLPR